MSDGRVVIDTELDDTGFRNGLNGLSSSLTKVAKLVAVAFSVNKLVSFGRQAVELASDLQEVQNVVDTAFGDMAYKMEEFADTAIETYGISKLVAKQTGSTYMSMAVGMGLASDSASDMAIQLTGLSADMASFYNVSQNVASIALNSIFTGETETLKKFGIVMTETNLQAFAYSQGLNKTIKSMTQAEKTQLRYNYVMNQTKLAQGDFYKTSDSWANQTRILSERWKEFLTIMGNGLVKVLTPVLNVLNEILAKMIDVGNAIADMFGFTFETTATEAINSTTDATNDLVDATEELEKAQKRLLGNYDKLNIIDKSVSAESPQGTASDTQSTTGLNTIEKETTKTTNKFTKALENLKKKLDDVEKSLIPIFKTIKDNILPILKTLYSSSVSIFNQIKEDAQMIFTDLVNIVIVPALNTLLNTALPILSEFSVACIITFENIFTEVNTIFNSIYKDVVRPSLELIMDIWQDIWRGIEEFWNEHGKPIFDGLNTAIDNTSSALQTLWDSYIGPILSNTIDNISKLWNEHLEIMFSKLLGLLGSVTEALLSLYNNAIYPIYSFLIETFGPIFAKVFSDVQDILADVLGAIVDIGTDWITILTDIADFFNSVFSGDFETAWAKIKKIFKDGIKTIKDLFRPVVVFFQGIVTKIKKAFSPLVNWLHNIFDSCVKTIKVSFSVIGIYFNKVVNLIKKPFYTIVNWFYKIFKNSVNAIKAPFNDIRNFFKNVWKSIQETFNVEKIKNFFNSVTYWIKYPFTTIGKWLHNTFVNVWSNIQSVFTKGKILDKFNSVTYWIKYPFITIVKWMQNIFVNVWSSIKDVFTTGKILDKFNSVTYWIKYPFIKIDEWLGNKFNDAWEAVKKPFTNAKSFFSNIYSDIKDSFGPLGWAIDAISFEGLSQISPATAIYSLFKKMNWLADGAVLPPNNPFLAVVGDQKSGTNVEAPAELIKQMVIEGLQQYGGTGTGNVNVSVVLEGDAKGVFKLVKTEQTKENKMKGLRV